MYRAALRSASRPLVGGLRTTAVRAAPRRFASTASPSEKARTWKGSAVRLGLAFAAVYYYNTSPVFADQAAETISAPAAFSNDDLPTVDSVIEEKRKQIRAQPEKPAEKAPADSKDAEAQSVAAAGSPAALEEEAGQQGAFNPETGEINWDCPCLGGMADGPCGEEFKTAFSCFVYSTEEPKGMDCIEKFQGMQECFKKYPEIYGAELQDDDDAEGAPETDAAAAATPAAELQKVEAETPAVEADSAGGVLAELAAEETPAPQSVEKSVDETKDVKEPEPKKVETKVEEKKTEEQPAEKTTEKTD